MRILIADDTRLMRALLSSWIVDLGHEVLLAEDGEAAERVAAEEDFQIAIIDWEMPKKNGLEVIQTLRQSPRSQYAHMIVCTAAQDPEMLINALEAGADDFIAKPLDRAVFLARFRAAARIVAMREDIIRLAGTDALTGVANRRSFFERAEEMLANARRTGGPVATLLIDIDYFKKINDLYGHAAGDQALRRFSETANAQLRPLDQIGRIGGEEFAVLLPDTTLKGALSVAERLRQAVAEAEIVADDGVRFAMTVSIGVCEVEPGVAKIDPALACADRALYRAKQSGRNRIECAEC